MLYIVYLVSVMLYLIYGISWGRMSCYTDIITLSFVLFPCLLILFCTRSFPAFGRSFPAAFGRGEYSLSQCRESLQSVRMVMFTAALFGAVCFFIGMINSIRSTDWSSTDAIGWVFLDLSVAMLSLFYSLLICAVLLPVYFMLKRRLGAVEEKR